MVPVTLTIPISITINFSINITNAIPIIINFTFFLLEASPNTMKPGLDIEIPGKYIKPFVIMILAIQTVILSSWLRSPKRYFFSNFNSTAKQNRLNPGLKIKIPGRQYALVYPWSCLYILSRILINSMKFDVLHVIRIWKTRKKRKKNPETGEMSSL